MIAGLRARYGWLDHALRANQRYQDRQGNLLAAGLSYYTIFAIFPLAMVGFSAAGFLLSRRPELLDEIERRIKRSIPGAFGNELISLMDTAIASRTSVGIIGLSVAGWVGLSWMANLREALGAMCAERSAETGFVHAKLSDLAAMVWAFAAALVTIGLTALGDPTLMAHTLTWLGVGDFALLDAVLRAASVLVAVLVAWLLFTWMIVRLPRAPVGLAGAIRGGAIAAIGYEVFKQAGSIYLRSVVSGPAGATFGPVLGLLVFAYVTARLVLFATAWAAVSEQNAPADPV